LGRGPLWRATLLRAAAERHVLLLTLHHIAADGWSMGVLVQEMAELYAAAVESRPARLPELPIQYADYAVWQREWLQGEVLAEGLAYWRQRLAGTAPVLELPADRSRPAIRMAHTVERPLALPVEMMARLATCCRREGVTLATVLMAGFAALLGRYSGQQDFCIGTLVAGRNRLETEGLLGLFINALALRADLTGDPDFATLLGRVRSTMLDADLHQDIPFEKLVEELEPDRTLAHWPLFQVMLVLENTPMPAFELPGLAVRRLTVGSPVARLDLTVTLRETPAGLAGTLGYSTDLFAAATVERFVGHFQVLLTAAAAHTETRVAELPLLSPAERQQLLREWHGAPGPGWGASLPRLLAARAAASPGAPAVIGGGVVLTYGELQARAGRLARRLRQLGVRAGARVGLCLERSPDLVVGLLATLRAGGTYVVLDPLYPVERLSFLLADSGAAVILGRSDLAARLPEGGPAVLFLDREEGPPAEARAPAGEEIGANEFADLLYIIYTSGSTGLPKGAGVYQRGFVNLLRWYVEEFGLSAADRFLVMTSPGFDLTQKNFFAPLLCGGLLVLADPGAYDPREILATVERHRITRLNCTPSAFYPLLEEGGLERLSSLRSVFLGGEPIAPARLASWRRSVGRQTAVVNTYGPTECTDVVACHRLASPAGAGSGPVPIGRPLPGCRLLVLDRQLSPVPIGVAGQLAVAGLGVGAGYLGRPELTAEKFVADPFAAEPGARLYWTGDLARTLPNGEIDFLGRLDHQVKVHGLRIELGEIETALGQHPKVKKAVVLARAGRLGDQRLVGYVIPAEEPGPVPEQLRSFLAERLPGYMVPADWVLLAELPLTANGKLDRQALPAPEESQGRGYLAPRSPVEEVLAGIWEEVLRRERVGVEDDFFALGGHSLMVTQVISRVRRKLGVELPLRAVFEAPRLAALAVRIAKARGEGWEDLPPLLAVPQGHPLPLSFAQERLWFLDQLEPGSAAYNIFNGIRLRGPLDLGSVAGALSEVVNRHESLRTRFAESQGQPMQVISPPAPFPLPLVDFGGLPPGRRESLLRSLATAEERRPFDLVRGPLLRATLVRLAVREHALLFSIHHIVSDGWSAGVLVREVGALYAASLARIPSPLPELRVQYADYAVWQRKWLSGERLEREVGYWRERLSGVAPLALATDRPRPAVQSSRGSSRPLDLSEEISTGLKALARRHQATLFMAGLSGFVALLARHSGARDLTVGTPVAGRARA
ncbi:MAG TPA: amino acid adenylation domain-containing protein, partial [Thermoanaerobaculia bacterium]|nr:amino acid adenylation domain-containing protein [Thermoanaerobaculia bacterium]